MAEYIEREALLLRIDWHGTNKFGILDEDIRAFIKAQPAADAVVVTRCKDCKHSALPSKLTQRYGKPGTLTCHNRYSPCNRRNVSSDNFCSYGGRKDGAE